MEHLIAHLIVPFIGRWFFRTVRRWPWVFAGFALAGECVGAWAVGFWQAGDWILVGIGILCLAFYTGLLILLAVKLRTDTWVAFCDKAEAVFGGGADTEQLVDATMHTITFYPKNSPLSLNDMREFVRSFPEGEWITLNGVDRGVIESEDGRIYLDYDDHYQEYFSKYLDERQRAELAARLGFSPARAVHIHASHAFQHSRELAQTVCESLAKKWGGGWSE